MFSISLDTVISHRSTFLKRSLFYSCLLGFLLPKIFKLFDFPIVFFVSLRLTSNHFESFTFATMIWLIASEYLCHNWPQISSLCRYHHPTVSTSVTHHRHFDKSNTTAATSKAGAAWLPELTAGFCWVPVSSILSFLCNVWLGYLTENNSPMRQQITDQKKQISYSMWTNN
jgi:hypothetical protein